MTEKVVNVDVKDLAEESYGVTNKIENGFGETGRYGCFNVASIHTIIPVVICYIRFRNHNSFKHSKFSRFEGEITSEFVYVCKLTRQCKIQI